MCTPVLPKFHHLEVVRRMGYSLTLHHISFLGNQRVPPLSQYLTEQYKEELPAVCLGLESIGLGRGTWVDGQGMGSYHGLSLLIQVI